MILFLGEKNKMDNNMMERIKYLKRELFMDGLDTIETFIGYKLNENEDDDVIERRVDIAIDYMSEDELNIWFVKYNIV
jgi:hypothetical protein|nr:MAG TPA: hypothetical protein [Bacteriophage sp.]